MDSRMEEGGCKGQIFQPQTTDNLLTNFWAHILQAFQVVFRDCPRKEHKSVTQQREQYFKADGWLAKFLE